MFWKYKLLLFASSSLTLKAQMTEQQVIEKALIVNNAVSASKLNLAANHALRRATREGNKIELGGTFGQYNSYLQDNSYSISQSFTNPSIFKARRRINATQSNILENEVKISEKEVIYQVRSIFQSLSYLNQLDSLISKQDSVYQRLLRSADFHLKLGEIELIEKVKIQSKINANHVLKKQIYADKLNHFSELKNLLHENQPPDIHLNNLIELENYIAYRDLATLPPIVILQYQSELIKNEKSLIKAENRPSLSLGYFNQSMLGTPHKNDIPATYMSRFQGATIGLSFPLKGKMRAKMKANELQYKASNERIEAEKQSLENEIVQLSNDIQKEKENLDYYRKTALAEADLFIQQANLNFKEGKMNYADTAEAMELAIGTKIAYFEAIYNHNLAVLALEKLLYK